MHLYCNCIAGVDSALPRYASCTARVAAHVIGGDAGNRAIGARCANTCVRLIDAIYPELLEEGVGGGLLDEQRGNEDKGLHGGREACRRKDDSGDIRE